MKISIYTIFVPLGKCLAISGATALPLKQCFCETGYFGLNCEKESSLKEADKNYDESEYKKHPEFGPVFQFMWKKVNDDELQGIIVADTTSYVAVGKHFFHFLRQCHSK